MASTPSIPTVQLNDGKSIPIIGYGTGTAWFKSGNSDTNNELVEAAKASVKVGFNHLDGAEVYGTEGELGTAIKESGVPREELFVTTKVQRTRHDIPGSIDSSLKLLGLDYVDLYLIHSPFGLSDSQLQEAWAAMEQVQVSGKARSIGVSNFLQSHLEAILKTAKVVPAVNQIEFHPYLQHGDLLEFHESKGIKTSGFGGITPITRAQGGPVDSLVSSLALKYGVSDAEVLLRWAIDRGVVLITTSSKEERLSGYLRALSFKLTPSEVDEISQLGQQKHHRAFWLGEFKPDDRS